MNIRQAILLAADSIEQNPKMFDFSSCDLPNNDCGTPGCALGWIAFHAGNCGMRCGPEWSARKLGELLSLEDISGAWAGHNFYQLMNEFNFGWEHTAHDCAKALRQYADKYHPATESEKPTPESTWQSIEELCGWSPLRETV